MWVEISFSCQIYLKLLVIQPLLKIKVAKTRTEFLIKQRNAGRKIMKFKKFLAKLRCWGQEFLLMYQHL